MGNIMSRLGYACVVVLAVATAGCQHFLPLTPESLPDFSLIVDRSYGYTLSVSHGFTVEEDIVNVIESREDDGSLKIEREKIEIFQRIVPSSTSGVAIDFEREANGDTLTVDFGDFTTPDGLLVENKFRFFNSGNSKGYFHLVVPTNWRQSGSFADEAQRCLNSRDVVPDPGIKNKTYVVDVYCDLEVRLLRTPYLVFRVDEDTNYQRYEVTPPGRSF